MTGADAQRHRAMIMLAPGTVWSGRARYAAAMYFHQRGEMDAEVLEIYRILSRLDAEDPRGALRHYGIGADWIARLDRFAVDQLPSAAL